MQIALIAPIPELSFTTLGDMHMLLAPLLNYREYSKHYANLRKQNEYLILDNGAHEARRPLTVVEVFERAASIGCQELVLPDVPMNTEETIEAMRESYDWLAGEEGQVIYRGAGEPALMIVPQGPSRTAWSRCLHELLEMHAASPIEKDPVIGIAKNHDDTIKDGGILWCADHVLESGVPPGNVHLLGWPSDPFSLSDVALRYPDIRSVDSAKPFVYAIGGVKIDPNNLLRYPKRREDYFAERIDNDRRGDVLHNIKMFRDFADAFPHDPLIDD